MNPLDACEQHQAGRDCKIHGPLKNTPATALRGVPSPDLTDRGGTMPPMTFAELLRTMEEIVADYDKWPGHLDGPHKHQLQRGIEMLRPLLGDRTPGLKAA